MTGDEGSDHFVFGTADIGGNDLITDWSNGGDKIEITGGASTATYTGDSAFHSTGTTEIRYAGGEDIAVDLDGNGTLDFTITLAGIDAASDLAQGDFI